MKKITLLFTVLMSTFIYSQNFSDHQLDSTTSDPLSVKIADLDEDGDLDIVAAFYNEPGNPSTGKLIWYENDGTQNYTSHNIDTAINGALYLVVKDITGDGHLDILLNAYDGNALYAFINTSISPVTFASKLAIDSAANGSNYSSAADFDGDSVMDAVSANYLGNELAWYKYTPPVTITKHIISPAIALVSSVETGDMDSDGDIDLVVTGNDQIYWYENDGTGTFTQHSIVSSVGFTGAITAYMVDFDMDGDMDIIGSASGADEVAWFENNGSQTFSKHVVATGVDYASYAQAADFNNDGNIDIIASATNTNELYYYENDGTNTSFISHLVLNGNPLGDSYAIDLADIDADGDVDIALTSPGPNILRWLENDFIGAPANDLCGNAFPIICGNNYTGSTNSATETDEQTGFCGTSQGAAGVWFKYVGDDNDVTLDLSASNFDTRIQVWSGSCGSLTCVGGDDDSGTSTTSLYTFGADTGIDYYVYVYGYSTNTGDFDLAVSCVPYPACPDVMNIAASNFVAPGNADLTWDVATGATGYNWEIQPQGTAQGTSPVVESGNVMTNTASTTLLVDDTDYTLYVQSDCGGGDLGNWMPYDFTFALPPSNDDACNAQILVVNDPEISGDNTGGTIEANEITGSAVTCSTTLYGTSSSTVWYKFDAIATNATITTDFAGGTLSDTQLVIYTTTACSDLSTFTVIGCDDDSGTVGNLLSIANLTGLTIGDTYYVQMAGYNANVGTFKIQVTSSTASIQDLSSVGFEYYPNPVNSTLTVKANENITNITIFNMLGQQVKQVNLSSLNATIDMTSLTNDTYFIKAIVGGKVGTFKILKK